jgi:hypothetical protein
VIKTARREAMRDPCGLAGAVEAWRLFAGLQRCGGQIVQGAQAGEGQGSGSDAASDWSRERLPGWCYVRTGEQQAGDAT